MTLSQRLPTMLLILATTAGATWTVLLAGGSGSLEATGARVIYDGMAALALLPWLVGAIFRPSWRPASRLAPGLLVVLAVFAVSSFTSRVPRLSLEMLAYAVLLVELYLLLVAMLRRPDMRLHIERLALTMCVIVCVLYLVQVIQAWIVWWDLVGSLAIPPLRPSYLGLSFGSPNPVATVVLLLGAFGLATLRLPARTKRVVTTAVLAMVGVTVVITGSRGAWAGALAGLLLAVVVAVAANSATRTSLYRQLRTRAAAAAMIVGIPLLGIAVAAAALSGRLTLEEGGYRAGFAAASLRMFGSSPILGTGPGTWPVLRAGNADPAWPDLYIPHAHNVYLQILAEFGIVGLVAGVLLVGAVVLVSVQAIRSDAGDRRRVGYAVIFAVGLMGVQQFADMLMNVPAVLLALAMPIAWLDAVTMPAIRDASLDRSSGGWAPARVTPVLAVIATVAILVGLARIEAVAGTAERGVAAAVDRDWTASATGFGEASAADPDLIAYRFELGVSAANAGDLALAERSLATSAAADDFTYAWLNLAAVRWTLGDIAGAIDALDRAERLGLQRTQVAVGAGWLRQRLGDEPAALADYATAVSQAPTLAADPFWSTSAGLPGGIAAVLPIVDQQASVTSRIQVDLILGRLDEAAVELAIVSPSDPGLYGLVMPAWKGEPAAWTALRDLAARRPLDGVTVGWARFVASHLGDDDAVGRYGIWLTTLAASDSGLPVGAHIVTGSAESQPPYFLDRYGSLYRRQLPLTQVINLLPQVVLADLE